jgi:hypothetical protein
MKLIFVYNADSGPISGLFDIGHKILSPATYQCGLCKLTFDTFTEKETWRKFRESSPVEMEFLHRDEFEKKYDLKYDYPVVLKKNTNIDVLLSKKEIDSFENLDELIAAVKSHLPV